MFNNHTLLTARWGMESQIWVVSTLLISIVLIVLTIVKLKFHPFLALLLASFFVGAMMG
ncbi:GntT/GntP/DsdX family permease, partial [Klebsiella pneumoniae]|nr:D-serine transporter DsdX [Klebsiella pneumoniae]